MQAGSIWCHRHAMHSHLLIMESKDALFFFPCLHTDPVPQITFDQIRFDLKNFL